MLKRVVSLFILSILVWTACPGTLSAASGPAPERGLLISPIRQFIAVDAGNTKDASFTVGNLTGEPLSVQLSVKQFSVADYTYNYKFQPPSNDWLRLSTNDATLQPGESRSIPYSLQVPTRSAPGGHYYTLFASATLATQGVSTTIQATDLIYLTVNGNLTTVSHLENSSIQWLNFGRSIPYSLQPINTGNTYTYVYLSGQLHGLFVQAPHTSVAHILMPGKVRALTDSIPSPLLPGIYRATYGYRTTSNWIIQQSSWIVYIPPWSIAFALAALLLLGKFRPRFSKARKKTPVPTTTDTN